MKFSNAYNGISKIFLAEILSIFAAITAIVGAALLIAGVDIAKQSTEVSVSGFSIGGGLFILATCIIGLVSLILYIMGLSRAAKDEKAFKSALTAALVGVIASIVAGIFANNDFVYTFATIIGKFTELVAFFYSISGICGLAALMQNQDLTDRSMSLMKIVCVVLVVSAILIIVTAFLPATNPLTSFLTIFSSICSIVAYIMYLVILSRAKKALAEFKGTEE